MAHTPQVVCARVLRKDMFGRALVGDSGVCPVAPLPPASLAIGDDKLPPEPLPKVVEQVFHISEGS